LYSPLMDVVPNRLWRSAKLLANGCERQPRLVEPNHFVNHLVKWGL
jgi:hypothetical protein